MIEDKNGNKAIEKLKESEERYRAIVAAFDGLIYICSQDFRVEFMNDKFIKRTGYYPIGELCYKALHELDSMCPWCVNERVFKGETVNWEVKSPKDDRWYYVVDTPIYHPDGRISKQAMILDITERKQSEMQIHKSEQLFRALVEHSPDFIARYDRDFRRIYVNPAIQKLFEKSKKEVLGETPSKYSPVYNPQLYTEQLKRVIETSAESTVEMPFRTPEGEMHWGHMRFVPEFDLDGNVATVLAIGRDIHKIKENEQRFRMLAENFPDFVVRFDRDCRLSYASPNIETVFGLPAEKMIDKTLLELGNKINPDRTNTLVNLIRRAFDEGVPNKTEAIWKTEAGERIFEVRHAPEKDATGNVVSVLGIIRDITEQKQAEEALKQSEARHMDLYENAPDMYLSVNAKTALIEKCNQTLINTLGYSKEDIIGQPVFEIYHPECRDEAKKIFKLFVKTGEIYDKELLLKNKDGSKRNVSLNVSAVRDEKGKIISSRSILRDITVRKRTEETLRKLSYAVEQSPASIIITDTTGNIEYVNPRFTEMTGYSEAEVMGKNPNILKSGKVPQKTYKQLWETISSGNVWRGEFHNKKKNGTLYWESVSISPIFDAAGTITHFIGVNEDITEKKRLEEHFSQVQKLEAVGQLAGGIAHDFNNMLTLIIGHTELALMKVDRSDTLHAQIQEIHKAAERSADLTRQLLAFARKQAIAPRVLNLNDTVSGILNMLQRLISDDIELAWKPGAELWLVKIDPSQIDQVLANLCVNARDAITGVGKVKVETGNIACDEAFSSDHAGFIPGEYVQLAVSDDGCGMEDETQAHIFEPFFTTKGIGQGTGLGLATVYGIVKQNQGFIYVYSKPGRGTTFKIYFPRHNAEPANTLVKNAAGTPLGGRETVLMVEDEKAILDLGKKILSELGYTVLIAKTPRDAIRLGKKHHNDIHLLITDVVMPDMNGRVLAERLASIKPGLKCLYMSGYMANVITHRGVLEEGHHFIQKPFSMKSLAVKIREVLDSKSTTKR